MKYIIISIFLLCSYSYTFGEQDLTSYEQVGSFYPENERLNQQNIEWGLFTVPENWEKPNENKITLAVAKLKNTSNKENAEAVVMIEGGPGASAIESIWWWLNHPLRQTNDIVLLDLRGTGFSEPRLCPELSKTLLNLISKDLNPESYESEKAKVVLDCKQKLIADGINTKCYNSISMSLDINALKNHLNYSKWNVYSVSYGTYVAQVYIKKFPNDVNKLILDSPIFDITKHYSNISNNYINSLEKVFESCKNDVKCSKEFTNLEEIYYETIKQLAEEPISVKVDGDLMSNGEFVCNSEDFKIAVHQALYQKKLVEVLPLMIDQFHKKNKNVLSALIPAFSQALGMDYGTYYSVICNEVITNNNIEVKENNTEFEELSFYTSDFFVCDQWNNEKDLKAEAPNELFSEEINIPALIFTGGFDPITPAKNGDKLLNAFENGQLVKADSYGHATSFSKIGLKTVKEFIQDPYKKVENDFNAIKTDFVEQVYINGGVSNMGNSLNNLDLIFFAPLAIALLISTIAIFAYLYSIFKGENRSKLNTSIKLSLIISSILSISIIFGLVLGLNNTASENFYILAFGLPEKYSFIFKLLLPLMVVLLVTTLFFILRVKYIKNRSVSFTVLFSNFLVVAYLLYWGIL